jgi:hypothetical protein
MTQAKLLSLSGLVIAVALGPACTPPAQSGACVVTAAAAPDPGSRDDSQPVARTARFDLYSRFTFNLHDRLRQWGVSDDRSGQSCIANLPAEGRKGWDRAVTAFHALRPEAAPPRLDLRLRYELLRPGDSSFDEGLGAVPAWYRAALADAAPAYRSCWWRNDDRRNREWIETLAARLARAEDGLARRIEAAHHVSLPAERIPVDVVPTVDFGGAGTVVHPHHILISSTQPGYEGFGGLETLFHEASHTVVNPGSDGSIATLRKAAEKQGVELPRDLWHAVLFFTAGEAAKKTVREVWQEPYRPYLYTSGLFERSWPTWREPLEQIWQPYLDGSSSLDDAAEKLVKAVTRKR